MKDVKCECGHINPHGTVLCESCGKPVEGENAAESKQLLDMRYDGSARRSQTYNKTIVDKIWNFFSSVKVGVWLIVITLAASALGTIFPQEMYIPKSVPPGTFYKDEYGSLGQLYYQLGFHDLYGSWWYMILIASIGISLVICSLDRVIPLYRALKKQGVTRHDNFMRRQRIYGETPAAGEGDLHHVKTALQKRRYQVRTQGENIFAEKGRFSRWGPYVNHVGLIIFLIGAMLRFFPDMYIDEVLWIREGETTVIPGTEGLYYLTNHRFLHEVYESENEDAVFEEAITRVGEGAVAKNFQSDVTLYERTGEIVHGAAPQLKKVTDKEIRVNEPLKFDSFALYQVDFKLNELNTMNFRLIDKESEQSFGSLQIDLLDPEKAYDLGNGYSVEISSYLPDFYFNAEGKPATKTRVPNNPAFVFKMIAPDKPEGETSFVAIQQTIEPAGDNQYKMQFESAETKNLTALTVRKDHTLWLLGIGGAIFMIGVIQGMYWNHRRIWLKRSAEGIAVAAHTNKNWFGLKSDIKAVLEGTSLDMPADQRENDLED
ncbi:cytochrome C biogenesis protein [Bacillus lacus]|uniref:Cytochrome C biogenesis protein n=1 Tax=Metabacillus lacus TaxID=1983721 RepID=A0A7X2IWS8_9BACI|nr:cytochrome c biogenesis protein ResB [Metabacillus lacus]MRX71049.1 cytochrome C biogenesis protein [Metabacillus lacus]